MPLSIVANQCSSVKIEHFIGDNLKRNLHIMSSWAVDCRDVHTPVLNGDINNDRGTSKSSISGTIPAGPVDQISLDDSGSTINRLV